MIRPLRPDLALTAVLLAGAGPLGACAEQEPRAAVLPPDDVELHWNEAFNGVDDRLAAVVPVDVMVYEAATGAPLPAARLLIGSEDPNVALLSPDAVDPVDPDWCSSYPPVASDAESEPVLVDSVLVDSVLVDSVPVDGALVDGDENSVPCSHLTWDAWRDMYLAVDGDVGPGELELWTDEDGVARAYVWVDAFPLDEDGFAPALVEIDLPDQLESGASFSLRPR